MTDTAELIAEARAMTGRLTAVQQQECRDLITRLAAALAGGGGGNGSDPEDRRSASGPSGPTEAVALWMIARGYATGHGDTTEDMLGELEWQAKDRGARSGSADA